MFIHLFRHEALRQTLMLAFSQRSGEQDLLSLNFVYFKQTLTCAARSVHRLCHVFKVKQWQISRFCKKLMLSFVLKKLFKWNLMRLFQHYNYMNTIEPYAVLPFLLLTFIQFQDHRNPKYKTWSCDCLTWFHSVSNWILTPC